MRVPVHYKSDSFNRPVRREKIPQLPFGGCRIQVSNKDVDHNFVFAAFSNKLAGRQKQRGDIVSISPLAVVGN